MADTTKTAARSGTRRRQSQEKHDGRSATGQAEQKAPETQGIVDEAAAEGRRDGGDVPAEAQGAAAEARGQQRTVTSELRDTIREAAIEVLRPVARKAATSAAKYAVAKGPDLVKEKLAPKVADAGGAGALAKDVASKGGGIASSVGGVAGAITGKLSGKAPEGTGRGRRLPVQEHVDVAVDLETAYDQWTQFEEYPRFMHRVEKIEQRDDKTLMWHENIWGVRRSWEAEITDQQPCERIAWRSKGGTQTAGVATFHRLSDRLTRVQVNLDFQPKGMFEKTASGTRAARRALKSDLMRFKAYIEMRDEATGAWRGRIEDGEVVETPGGDEPEEREEREGEREQRRPKARKRRREPEEEEGYAEEEQDEEDEDAEPLERGEVDEEDEPVAEAEEEDEDEEPPVKKPARRRAPVRSRR